MVVKKHTYRVVFFLLLVHFTNAQQDPQYTQYMYNMSVVNPAYTTNEPGLLNFGLLYRSQWQNAIGAPKTFSFFAHGHLGKNVEAGVSVINDIVGDGALKENNIYADFAYILKLDGKGRGISFGLKGGFTSFETNFRGFQLPEFQDDPAFNENLNSIFPNVGIGAFYFQKNFYAGVSVPNMLNSKHLENPNGINRIGAETTHFFLTAGYVYELNPMVKIKPSILSKMVSGVSPTFDFSLNVRYNDTFEAGLSYRLNDSVIGMFNIAVAPYLRLGYAYDHTISNLGAFNDGSHEVLVLFDLDFLGLRKGYDKSPRFY